MARTKNKAKTCTGGSAPRKAIGQKPSPLKPDMGSRWDAPSASEADPWCVLCFNGGILLECACNRSLCFECIPQVQTLSPGVLAKATFKCPVCEGCTKAPSVCYRGLYDETGRPLFPDGLSVESATYFSLKTPLKIPRLCILDICLVGLSFEGGPAHLLSNLLLPWYMQYGDKERLLYCRHTLNLVTNDSETEYAALGELGQRAASYDHVMVFLCTHSDVDRGDLFWEPAGTVAVAEFFNEILVSLLDPIKNVRTTLFLLSCGSVVTQKESLSDLQQSVVRYNIDHAFAFGAASLVPNTVFPFVQEYVMSIVLRDRDVASSLEDVLDQCRSVGRHTHILWFRPTGDFVRFAWVETVVRPWGQVLPIQCKTCMSVFCWRKGKTSANGDILFVCVGRTTDGRDCKAEHTVSNVFNLVATKKTHRGTWLKA